MNLIHKNIACKRLRAVGLSQQQTLAILNLVSKWIRNNGEEWTINRLKSFKVAYVNKLAGKDELFDRDSWIRHHQGGPKGVFKRVFSMKKPQKSLSALMVYTQYVAKELTKAQLEKFQSAVTTVGPSTSNGLLYVLRVQARTSFGTLNSGHFHKVERWTERTVRVPYVIDELDASDAFDIQYRNKVVSHDNGYKAFERSVMHPLAQAWIKENYQDLDNDIINIYHKMRFEPLPLTKISGEDRVNTVSQSFTDIPGYEGVESIVGRIGFIQEPGYKLRSVANPYPVFQLLLSRLGTSIYQKLETIPEDCTFNQDKAVNDVQEFLRKNDTELMSIDLSSATDRFPLDVQLAIIEELGANPADIQLLKSISRGDWEMPGHRGTIRWGNGQPLGNYPSFGLFALSHHVLARYCKPIFYRILGDDIVIDIEAGRRLRRLYNKLDLVISESKSITSSVLAEFGGRLITKEHSYVQPKWKVPSDRSFIELARNLGPKSLGLFTRRQRRVLNLLADVPREVHPWGLNWNTKGLPYAERLNFGLLLMTEMIKPDTDVWDNQAELKDLKLQILINDENAFPSSLERTRNKMSVTQTIGLSFEERILNYLEIGRAEFLAGEIPAGWSPSIINTDGDPRGTSALSVAEKKFRFPER
jgi:hypothetical protein